MSAVAEDDDVRTYHLALDLCLRVGELLLSSGAGAADVNATMASVARHFGLRNVDIDVTFTSLTMSYSYDPELPPLLLIRNVKNREIDYEDLTQVDHLVRDILTNKADLYLARSRMATIVTTGHTTPRWAVSVGLGLMASGIGLLLGGDAMVTLVAFVAAVSVDRLQILMSGRRLPGFYQQVAGGAVATLIAVGVAASPLQVNTALVVSASIILLLSGLGFVGALQDALTGFYITASARLLEVTMATAGIIGGVSAGLGVASMLGVGLGQIEPGATSLNAAAILTMGGALCAAAFAFSSYAPVRALLPIALIGTGATAIYNAVNAGGLGRAFAAAAAAYFVGVVSYSVSGRIRVPPLIIVVPGVTPMLPGLSIYRGLALLADETGNKGEGLLSLATAVSVAIALAAGVILGEYTAQPLKREARRLEDRLAGPRLIGPFRARGPRDRPAAARARVSAGEPAAASRRPWRRRTEEPDRAAPR